MKTGLMIASASPKAQEGPKEQPKDLGQKAKLFWKKTLEAGERHEKLSPLQKLKGVWVDFHWGQAKGMIRGLGSAVKDFFNPSSDLLDTDYEEILEDVRRLPEAAMDHGITYMDSDWEKRGELNGEKTVEAGLWIVKIYLGAKALTKGAIKNLKKF